MTENIMFVLFLLWSQVYFIALPIFFYRSFKGTFRTQPIGWLLGGSAILGVTGEIGCLFVAPFFLN